jgi:preprotein translocase subunit SecD
MILLRALSLALLASCAAASPPAASAPAAAAAPRFVHTLVAEVPAGADPAALVAIWTRRFAGLDASIQPSGQPSGRTVTIAVPARDGWKAAMLRDLVTVGGRLEVRLVAEASALAPIIDAMPGEPGKRIDYEHMVMGTEERWTVSDGVIGSTSAFIGRDEASIRAAIAAAAARSPAAVLPTGIVLAFRAEEQGPMLRTAVAVEAPTLTGADVAQGHVRKSPTQDGHDVELTFTDAGKARFRLLTAGHVGRKVALIVDGIATTPVIGGPIVGGRVALLPRRESAGTEAEASLLLRVVTAPLPAGVAVTLRDAPVDGE